MIYLILLNHNHTRQCNISRIISDQNILRQKNIVIRLLWGLEHETLTTMEESQ